MFKDMSDWDMAKDYNGAERFNDGSRPQIAETESADITISGIPGQNEVSIGVYPYHVLCGHYYEGKVATKELANQIGTVIAKYINANSDGSNLFTDGKFADFFKTLKIADIRTHDSEMEPTQSTSCEQRMG